MYTGAALRFGLIRAYRSGLVLYCSVLSDAGGENDGSSAIFERSLLATLVVDFAEYLHKQLHVECVIINSVVPRNSKNMSCSAEVFRANMAHFNAVIENYCVSSRKQGLIYNHLRGFFNHKINKRDVPLAPEVWTTDGIHCNPEKYKLRVRFAIMDATTRLGQ